MPHIRFLTSNSIQVLGETPVELKLNLLAHAQIQEIDIGSRCGGYGECGGDRVRIAEGADALSPITQAEREHLSAEEIARGCRLACQAFPNRKDSAIAVECLSVSPST